MGCICSKGIRANQFIQKSHRGSRRAQKISASPENDNVGISTAIAEAFAAATHPGSSNAASASSAQALSWDRDEKASALSVEKYDASTRSLQRRPTIELGGRSINSQTRGGRLSNVSNGERGAQVIAGWPSWLASVAGEAINGWVPRKADSFEKLEKIGQGTYSSVYKARDLETNKIVALKKVKFTNMDPESVRFMAREIIILRRLNHPNVMKLEGIITSRMSASIYLIFEYMDHDLAGLASSHGVKFTESQIKCYMQQLLRGLEHCHSHGVLHRDVKGSNLLIDQNGNLKIGDFGLATFFRDQHNQQQQPLTSRVVTLWYRPPELLLGATEYGEAVDLWSSGCILAELFSGKPIMPGRTEVEQMHKIFKLCGSPSEEYWRKSKLPHATIFKPQNPYKRCIDQTFKDLPASALRLLDTLLAIEPQNRVTALSALSTEFFNTAPFPCDPSGLPKYPPSKEFDLNSGEAKATRKKMDVVKARGCESLRHFSREHRTKQALDGKSDLQGPIQKSTQGQSNKNIKEDSSSGFIDKNQKGQFEHRTEKLIELKAQAFHSLDQEACRVESSELNTSKGSNLINPHLPELCLASGNTNIDGSKSVENHEQLQKDGEESSSNRCLTSVTNNDRVCHSGPLMPPGGSMDEMLRKHEKRIQEDVRRARGERARTRSNSGFNLLSESLNNELNDR